MKPKRIESLVCLGYNGGLFPVYTPGDLRGVAFGEDEHKPTPAQYERPRTSEGVEYGSIADVVRGTGKDVVMEQGELLSAGCNSYPIHDAPKFARWITPADKVKIDQARERVEAARKQLYKVIRNAFDAGLPITPEQVRALGTGDPRHK